MVELSEKNIRGQEIQSSKGNQLKSGIHTILPFFWIRMGNIITARFLIIVRRCFRIRFRIMRRRNRFSI